EGAARGEAGPALPPGRREEARRHSRLGRGDRRGRRRRPARVGPARRQEVGGRMRGRLACAVLVLLPSIAAADGGGSLVVADPKGALGDQASVAGGVSGHYALPLGSPFFSLRLEGSALLYGTETIHLPVVGTAGRINREITTDNWIVQAGAGPQVVFPTGR